LIFSSTSIQSITFTIHKFHSSVAIPWSAQWKNLPAPRIELGPALQQADAPPSELRRTRKSVLFFSFF
jgi:hypothetical protein